MIQDQEMENVFFIKGHNLQDTKQMPIMEIKCMIKQRKGWQRICYTIRVKKIF